MKYVVACLIALPLPLVLLLLMRAPQLAMVTLVITAAAAGWYLRVRTSDARAR